MTWIFRLSILLLFNNQTQVRHEYVQIPVTVPMFLLSADDDTVSPTPKQLGEVLKKVSSKSSEGEILLLVRL